MLILLPPSEGKTAAEKGKPLNIDKFSRRELNDRRLKLISAVEKLANGPIAKSRAILGLSAKQDFEIERDRVLSSAPTARAIDVYTGVVFEALDVHSLNAKAFSKLNAHVNICSALFGLVSLEDYIPAYRLSGDSMVPKIGSLATYWKSDVATSLSGETGLIVDMRSGTYLKLGSAPAEQTLIPKILQKMPSGPPKVVSHFNKATKGRITRAFAQSSKSISTVDQFATLVAGLGHDVEIIKPVKVNQATVLNVIVDQV